MYESPVTLIQRNMMAEREKYILTAIREAIGVAVDKEELIKALKYDREQYEKGFKDGKNSRPKDKWYCPNCGTKIEIDDEE